MIKLLDSPTKRTQIPRDVSHRIQMFLAYVEDALGNGNPLDGQRKLRSITRKLARFERGTEDGDR